MIEFNTVSIYTNYFRKKETNMIDITLTQYQLLQIKQAQTINMKKGRYSITIYGEGKVFSVFNNFRDKECYNIALTSNQIADLKRLNYIQLFHVKSCNTVKYNSITIHLRG